MIYTDFRWAIIKGLLFGKQINVLYEIYNKDKEQYTVND